MTVRRKVYLLGKTFKIGFLAFVAASAQFSWAAWEISGLVDIPCNTATTLSLQYNGTDSTDDFHSAGTLWIASQDPSRLFMPETVPFAVSNALLPVFVRGEGANEIQLYDDILKSTTSLEFMAVNLETSGTRQWIPSLQIDGDEERSVVSVNKISTATLTLNPGTGVMPPSSHISVADHRGRVVFSRFYPTFELIAGLGSLQLPVAGQYQVTLRLLQDDVTSLPAALKREPEAIPFGKTALDLTEPPFSPEGVTTQTVAGMRVSLEHIPTTATIVGEDRLQVVALAHPSKEIQKNRWPFVIAGADLISMPILDQKENGPRLVRWQRRLGSSFAPVMLEWNTIQKSPGLFKWSSLNSALPIYRKAIVRPLLTVSGPSAWSQELPTETSATLNAWTGFTRQLSEKYSNLMWGLQCWKYPEEVWKNPNGYGELIDATIEGFQLPHGKRVPTPPLIIGGSRNFDQKFFEPLMTSDTVKSISGVSFDLFPKNPKSSPEDNGFSEVLSDAAEFIRKQKAETIKLWILGTGWHNGPDGVTRNLQANYLVRTHVIALSHKTYKLYWNSLADKSALPWASNPADRMGLLDDQLFPKASGVAYNLMTYMMSGAEHISTSRQGSVNIYKFNIPLQNNKWPGLLYVAWTESPRVQDVHLEMTHGGGVYALDYLGAEIQTQKVSEDSVNSIEGSYSFPVGFEPVYIWDAGKPGQSN